MSESTPSVPVLTPEMVESEMEKWWRTIISSETSGRLDIITARVLEDEARGK